MPGVSDVPFGYKVLAIPVQRRCAALICPEDHRVINPCVPDPKAGKKLELEHKYNSD